jgi:hypothetical protein
VRQSKDTTGFQAFGKSWMRRGTRNEKKILVVRIRKRPRTPVLCQNTPFRIFPFYFSEQLLALPQTDHILSGNGTNKCKLLNNY